MNEPHISLANQTVMSYAFFTGVGTPSDRGNLAVKDGTGESPPLERGSARADYGMSRSLERRKSLRQQWMKRSLVEPPGLVNTVTRGKFVEGSVFDAPLTTGALC